MAMRKLLKTGFLKLLAALKDFVSKVAANMCESWWLKQARFESCCMIQEEQNVSKKCKSLLIKQLEMNEHAWKILQNNGINAGDEFCFNFRFAAPNHACGESLKDSVSRKTDYTVHSTSESRYKKNRLVEGTTKPLKVSKEAIDKWVSEMVKLGLQHDCTFSGWWVWKYDDFACPGSPSTSQNFGSIIEDKPRLLNRLTQLIKK
jgi:hypothetical protein